jgi:hypothetical protein
VIIGQILKLKLKQPIIRNTRASHNDPEHEVHKSPPDSKKLSSKGNMAGGFICGYIAVAAVNHL